MTKDARERQASAHPYSSRMTNVAVEQWLPRTTEAVEQRLSHATEAVEQRLPHDDAAVGPQLPPRATGAVEDELSRLEEGVSSSSESDTSVSSSGSRRTKTFRRLPRRLKPHRNFADPPPGRSESVCIIEVASPPDDAKSITRLPGLSWKKFLRDLKAGDIKQETLKASGNPVYETVREFADVFPDKIPAVLPTDCGKATGGWRIVHAFNKLNDATIPAQTPIPGKDMVLDSMSGSVVFGAIDLTGGFYQILMRESDIPLTAVSTPIGMLWEWLVMPQGLKNAPATFNRMVSHVLRPLRDFAPSYFDDIFVHSRAEDGFSAVEVHIRHLRQVFQVMRANKLYANLKKCVFCAPEIPVLGCYVSKKGPFHVVCDASDFAFGCALMQDRVVSYQSRQMKPAERNYPVHDKERLAIRYTLIKFRVYLLGEQAFAVYTDHASLRTAMKSPHLSQRMARWLSFFAEYNFVVHYKPDKNNILADALSRRPDNDPRVVLSCQVIDNEDESDDHCAVRYANILAYLRSPNDETLGALSRNTRNQIDRYHLDGDLLYYNIDRFDAPRVVVPNDDDLRARIIHEFHDSPT
ncbi:polyprotein, partial [Phytophthora palmivora]